MSKLMTKRPSAHALAFLALGSVLLVSGTSLMAQELETMADATAPAAFPDPEVEAEEQQIGEGMASYYGNGLSGRRTASGERFDPSQLTAAHRNLPFGSRVRVTHQPSGQSVIVRINDRGPFHGNRVIDVSEAAARQLGLIGPGTGKVSLSLIP